MVIGMGTKMFLQVIPKNSSRNTCKVTPSKNHACRKKKTESSGGLEAAGIVEAFK